MNFDTYLLEDRLVRRSPIDSGNKAGDKGIQTKRLLGRPGTSPTGSIASLDRASEPLGLAGICLIGPSDVTVEDGTPAASADTTLCVAAATSVASLARVAMPPHLAIAWHNKTELDAALGAVPDGADVAFSTEPCDAATLANRISALLVELSEWDERMQLAGARSRDLMSILEVGEELLENPVALLDEEEALIGYAGDIPKSAGSTIWGEVLDRGYSPMSFFGTDELDDISRQLASDGVVLIAPRRGGGSTHLGVNIYADGAVLGCVALVDVSSPITQGQVSIAMHIARRMERLAETLRYESHGVDEAPWCLSMVLDGAPLTDGLLRFHLRRIGWKQEDGYRALCFRIPTEDGSQVEANSYVWSLRQVMPKAISVPHEDVVVAVWREKDYDVSDPALTRALCADFPEERAVFGVSSPFENFRLAASAYAQAHSALAIGERVGWSGMVSFDEVFDAHLYQELDGDTRLAEFMHPAVLRLLRSTKPSRMNESLESLFTYLMCGRNVSQAAKRLYMHRNTLEYRLDAIQKSMGCDLSACSEDELFRMALSCVLAIQSHNNFVG